MTAKLKIDLTQGILEVEGSETFVKNIFNDFKAQFIQGETGEQAAETRTRRRRTGTRKTTAKAKPVEVLPPAEAAVEQVEPPAPPAIPPPTPKEPLPGPKYTRIDDLQLGATAGHPSLVEFMDSKLPITNEERNLVFLYYLQHIINLETITIDHIYTCYREVNIRAPLNIEQSLRLTARQKGWIEADDGQVSVTPDGRLYVEKQLPKKVKS